MSTKTRPMATSEYADRPCHSQGLQFVQTSALINTLGEREAILRKRETIPFSVLNYFLFPSLPNTGVQRIAASESQK